MKRPVLLAAVAVLVGALVVAAPLSASAAAPVISVVSPVSITDDTTPVSPFSGDSIADADNDTLSVSVSWTSGGTVAGSASPVSTSGAPAAVTTWLRALVYTPAVGVTTTASFTISVDDGGGAVTDSSVSVQVTAVAVDLHIGASGTGTYGGAATVSPVYPSGMTGVDTSGVVCTSTTTATDPAGTYATAGQCSGAASLPGFTYNFIYDLGAVVIDKAPLTVTASTVSGMYGSLPTPTPGYSGLVNGETSVAGIACTTVAPVVPSAPTRCSGTAANYSLTFVDGTATVTQAPLTLTPSNAQATYGSLAPVTATPTGFVSGDTMASLTTQPTCTTSAGATAHVGGYPATTTCAGAVATNYAISYGASGTTTITPASLTITALGKSRLVGQANGDFSATTVGFVNGQTIANLTGTLRFTTAATAASGPGSYPVQPSGVSSTDYAITFVPGVVTVTAVAPTPTPTPTATVTPSPSPSPTPPRTPAPTPTPTPDPTPTSNDLGWVPWVIVVAGVVFIAAIVAIILWRRRAA